MTGTQMNGDQYDWHADWAKVKDSENILFIKFEETETDVIGVLRKIAQFLKLSLSDGLLQRIVEFVDDVNAEKMKEDTMAMDSPGERYDRQGQSIAWRKYFTVDQNERFDRKYKELYANLDLDVEYE